MRRFRYLLMPALMLLFISALRAQPLKQFSKEPAKFLDELRGMFDAAQSPEQKEAGKAAMAGFTDSWNNNKLNASAKDSVYALCNIMLAKKMKTFPVFESFISAVVKFSNSAQPEESFEAWCFSLRKLAGMSNTIRFMALVEATNDLLSDNTLYRTNILYWKASDNNFVFKFDSVPYVEFTGPVDLVCYKKNDSSNIYGTAGRYFPTTNKWKGRGGKIFWDRSAIARDEVWAEIDRYELSINKTDFRIDSVVFYNKKYFQRPLYGYIQDKVMVDVGEDRVSYPRFTSYENRLEIREIFKEIDFEGGFAMWGAKLMGKGDKENDAVLQFARGNKRFVKVSSQNFIIKPDGISADRAKVAVYWEKDSIYHPSVKLKYNHDVRELSLIRGDEGVGQSPFFDSYHKVDIYVEAVYWKMEEPKIEFRMLKGSGGETSAIFESDNYYSQFRYDKLRGMEDIHPLMVLRDIAAQKGSKVFTVDDVQRKMRVGKEQIQALLILYACKGFIVYDFDTDKVILKDRVLHYINAKNGKTDYDVIQFNSTIAAQSNATLNLLNFDFKLRGVPMVYLSDSQNVFVVPVNQELILKKNRDFIFDGQIHAGLFDLFGKGCTFNYDKFKFDLPTIDSMSFKVQDRSQPKDNFGHHPLVKVRTVIEDLTGDLVVDAPNNKSGLKPFPGFPSFNSKKESYVYYDKPFIYDKVYSRDRFFFRLQPFEIDSLDDYDSEKKEFGGYLVSAGIFPDIVEPLRVQPDFSLGFVKRTPPAGLPAYGGKGTYDSIVDLSYKGFRGRGRLKYLTSVTQSNDFVFFPDSMWAEAYNYVIREKKTATEYPSVYANNVNVRWFPYHDLMVIRQKDKPMAMFDNGTIMKGLLFLRPSGLRGDGVLSFTKVEMASRDFSYGHHVIDADTANVKFKTTDLNDIVLYTENYNVHTDFQTQISKFKSNDENSKISFPFNQYSCYMYNFDWYMDKDLLKLSSSLKNEYASLKSKSRDEIIGVEFGDSKFVSEHPSQDSLDFYAPDATYNLTENIIYATEVPVIFVADAAIFPDSGNVTILKKAEIVPLEKAHIVANVESKFHHIYEAKLSIYGAKSYSGSGSYDYKDLLEKTQRLYLNTIKVDTAGQTIGQGDVVPDHNFLLSPWFGFIGKVNLRADQQYLYFDGGARIKHECDTLLKRWMRFTAQINPYNVAIPVNEDTREYLPGLRGDKLGMGMYLGEDSALLYTAFVQKMEKSNDPEVVSATGTLTFNKDMDHYVIQPTVDSMMKYIPTGNVMIYDRKNCTARGSGKIDIGTALGQVQMETYGVVTQNLITRTSELSLCMLLDFFFDDDAIKIMSQILEAEAGTEGVNTGDDKFYSTLKFILGPQKGDEMLNQLNLSGRMKDYPKDLSKWGFFFAELNLTWNPRTKSFINDGKIGIASIRDNQMYKYVTGYVEIARKRSGNILNLYLESANQWFFFSYQNNKVQAISSKKEFNDAIKKAMDDNKNILKGDKGVANYAFIISTPKRKSDFLKKMGAEGEVPDNE